LFALLAPIPFVGFLLIVRLDSMPRLHSFCCTPWPPAVTVTFYAVIVNC
jgi:hypothetical protein